MTAWNVPRPLVLVDVRMARRRRTGVARYAGELRAGVERAAPGDLRVVFVSGPPGLPRRNRLTSVGNLVIDLTWTHLGLPALAAARRASLIHAAFNWAPVLAPCPRVVTVHDLSWERLPADYPAGFRRYARLFTRLSARRARVVIAVSAATGADLVDLYRVPSSRITVVPHGVQIPPVSDVARDDVILHVGEFEPRKRVPTLIHGHARYWANGGRHRLVIAGAGGSDDGAVRRAAMENPGCDLRGFVSDAELAQLYARATLAVTLSRHEGFGLPVLEAMAAGCAVMVSDTPALVEVAGEPALVIDDVSVDGVARALDGALGNPADLAARGRRGRARAAGYTWDAAAAMTLDVYRRAIVGPR